MKHWILAWMLLGATTAHAADVYWNPGEALSLAGMVAGDTLYVCGLHDQPNAGDFLRADGVSGITITGACPGNPGILYANMMRVQDASNVTVEDLTVVGDTTISVNNKGIALFDVDHILIQRVVCTGTRYCVYTHRDYTADDVEVAHSHFSSAEQGILLASYGTDPVSVKKRWHIHHNSISDIKPTAEIDADREPIGVQGGQDILIEHNIITDSWFGIILFACETSVPMERITVQHNILREIRGSTMTNWPSKGILKVCASNPLDIDIVIAHNLVLGVDSAAIRYHAALAGNPVAIEYNIMKDSAGLEVSGNVELFNNVEN